MLTLLAISFGLNSTIFLPMMKQPTLSEPEHIPTMMRRSYEDPYQELAQILLLTSSHVLPVSPAPAVI